MTEEQEPPRDYVVYQGSRHFSSIAIPATSRALEMKLAFLSLTSTHQFTAMDHEDPYTYLDTFFELVGRMDFQACDIENFYMRLFLPAYFGRSPS